MSFTYVLKHAFKEIRYFPLLFYIITSHSGYSLIPLGKTAVPIRHTEHDTCSWDPEKDRTEKKKPQKGNHKKKKYLGLRQARLMVRCFAGFLVC